MSRSKRLLYSVAADGGADGVHLLRGPFIRYGEGFQLLAVYSLEDFAPTGVTILLGWPASPYVFAYLASDAFTGSPRQIYDNFPNECHFLAAEPAVITISGGPLVAGSLELVLETVNL